MAGGLAALGLIAAIVVSLNVHEEEVAETWRNRRTPKGGLGEATTDEGPSRESKLHTGPPRFAVHSGPVPTNGEFSVDRRRINHVLSKCGKSMVTT